jgi:hypothetical protein
MQLFRYFLFLFLLSCQIPTIICLGTWTWMYGEKTVGSNGVYGIKGDQNLSYIPSARELAACSYDKSSNTLWFFGGYNLGNNKHEY